MACSLHGEHDDSMMRAIDVSITDNVARICNDREQLAVAERATPRNSADTFRASITPYSRKSDQRIARMIKNWIQSGSMSVSQSQREITIATQDQGIPIVLDCSEFEG